MGVLVAGETRWMRHGQGGVPIGECGGGQRISPAARRSATAASSEVAYRSPAATASGTMFGRNTVAFGAAKS